MIKFIKDAIAKREDAEGEKGFTLVELIVVVAILAILAAIAIPAYGKVQENARHAALETAAANAATSVAAGIANGITDTSKIDGLGTNGDITTSAPATNDDVKTAIGEEYVIENATVNTDTSNVLAVATNSKSETAWAGNSVYGTWNNWTVRTVN
jgi:type IV pilus assembly protein PilA